MLRTHQVIFSNLYLYLLLKRVRFPPKFLVWYVGLVRLCYWQVGPWSINRNPNRNPNKSIRIPIQSKIGQLIPHTVTVHVVHGVSTQKVIGPTYLWVKFILSVTMRGQNASQQKFRIFEGYGSFINSTRFICDELHKCIHSCTRCFSLMATKDAVSLMFSNNSAQCNNTSVRTNCSTRQSLSTAGPKILIPAVQVL